MVNILENTSQRHLKKDNCGNYVKAKQIMKVKITRNGNTYSIKNLKNFVKEAMHPVNHSMYYEIPMLSQMISLC